jgi:hypothetical protein
VVIAAGIGARAGLGNRHRAQSFAARIRREIFLTLLIAHRDHQHAEIGRIGTEDHRHDGLRELLVDTHQRDER